MIFYSKKSLLILPPHLQVADLSVHMYYCSWKLLVAFHLHTHTLLAAVSLTTLKIQVNTVLKLELHCNNYLMVVEEIFTKVCLLHLRKKQKRRFPPLQILLGFKNLLG